MGEDTALLTLELPRKAEAPAAARKALTSLNGSLHLVSEARLHDAQLLVTELVTNALRHGGADEHRLALEVTATPEVLHVSVTDGGEGFDPEGLAEPSSDRSGGWGLHIVAAVAQRWGVERDDDTRVWFEIDRPQRATRARPEPTPPSNAP
jgi:anti-sigma regulatory factor (Ser/Thr protein kinase)